MSANTATLGSLQELAPGGSFIVPRLGPAPAGLLYHLAQCCGIPPTPQAAVLRELGLFLSVPLVPSQNPAQRANQDVSLSVHPHTLEAGDAAREFAGP